MVGLAFLFWMFILLFAVIGMTRGWAKEILVTFAVVLGIFLITLLDKFAPGLVSAVTSSGKSAEFWLHFGIITAMVIFGYQSPNLPRIAESPKFIREHMQDTLLGLFIGIINGFLIFGSIWYYLHQAGYPIEYVQAPVKGTEMGDAALKLIPLLAPAWLGAPLIYFITAIAFVLVIVIFL